MKAEQINTGSDDFREYMEVMMLGIVCRNQTGELTGIGSALSWSLFEFILTEYLEAKYEGEPA